MRIKVFPPSHWAVILLFLLLTIIYFRKFFFAGLLPIPADIIAGIYYPWRDYSWGYAVAVPVKNPLPSDIVSFVYPVRMLGMEMLKHGAIPLWNPFILSGTVLMANFQSQIFYPTSLLYFLFQNHLAWTIGVVMQPFISLVFMYVFLHDLLKSKLASIFGAIAFAFSAYSVTWLEYNTHGHVGYWLPLSLFFIQRYLNSKKILWLICLSVAICLQLLAGYPQMVLYSLFAIGLYLLFVLISKRPTKQTIKDIFLVSAAIFFGLLGSSIQLLPGYEFLNLSNRFEDTVLSAANGGYLPWRNLITSLAPDFFGHPVSNNYWGLGFYDNFAFYAGVPVTIFCLFAIYHKQRRLVLYLSCLLVISLLLSFKTPLSTILSASNILGFRAAVAARALFLTDFALSVLAAIGFSWLLEHMQQKISFKALLRPVAYPLALFVPIVALFFGLRLVDLHYGALKPANDYTVALRNSAIPLFLLLAVALLLLMYWKIARLRLYVLYFMILLLTLDLFRYGNKYLSFTPKRLLYPQTPALSFVSEHTGLARINGGDAIPMNFWLPYGLYSASGYDANYPLRYAQFLSIIKGGSGTTAQGRYGEIVDYNNQLLNLIGVRYVFAQKWTPAEEVRPYGVIRHQFRLTKFSTVTEDKSVSVLENKAAFPRAFLTNEYVVAKSNSDIATLLKDPKINLHRTVVLESEPVEHLRGTTGSATIVDYQPNKVTLQTKTNGSMLLFLSDTDFPGWRVYIDGLKKTIDRADFTFRSVIVPEGEHMVEYRYVPTSFAIGARITLAFAVIVGGVFGYYVVKKRI